MYPDLTYLHVSLPEDIQRMKWHGDFDRAIRVIERRIEGDIPEALRKRLILEKDILKRMPDNYPHTWEQALSIMDERIQDFHPEELDALRDENAIEWIYVDGQVRVKGNFFSNLMMRPELAARVKDASFLRPSSASFLDDLIARAKKQGGLAYRLHLRSTMTFTPDEAHKDKTVRAWLPLPVEYAQVRNFQLLSTSQKPLAVSASDYPHRTICFDVDLSKTDKAEVEYSFESHMPYIEPDPAQVYLEGQPTFYTQEQLPHIAFTPYLRQLTRSVIGHEKNPLLKARRIYEYITDKVNYSFVRYYCTFENISDFVATSFKGDCGMQALLFITMCRIAGVPARWQSGLYAEPGSVGMHDWAQFYVAPYGWMFADCSFGGSAHRNGNEERRWFYFGHLEPFRVPAASEFLHPLYPPTHFLRCDPCDNQVGEAEYSDGGLMDGGGFDTDHQLLSYEEIPLK